MDLNHPVDDEFPTWLHLVVSVHAVLALSLCVFTVLGYVANTISMTLVVLFIFQTLTAILGLTAIDQNRRDYRALYITVNAITTVSAIMWSIFLLSNLKTRPLCVPIIFLIIALFSLTATILLIFCADKRVPECLGKVICLNLFPFVKLLRDANRKSKMADLKIKLSCKEVISFFGRENSFNDAQLTGTKEVNSAQLTETKEVNSNESLNGSIRSVAPHEQQRDNSELKTGVMTNMPKGHGKQLERKAMLVRRVHLNFNEQNPCCFQFGFIILLHIGRCLVIGSNWRLFYSVPILNACNVALCSTGRIAHNRLRRRLFIKKCRNKYRPFLISTRISSD
uniref:G_PROTEIN_RECEP_F2_4 domain-containing protein n=1 Tax=Elaeophora elaphi TaxID=1147741 RepID=A0A0R3RFH9_9BILA